MRDDEKYLVEVPLRQLSRLSQLIVDLRRNPGNLCEYPTYNKVQKTVADYIDFIESTKLSKDRDGAMEMRYQLWDAVLYAIGDLISEAVWSK